MAYGMRMNQVRNRILEHKHMQDYGPQEEPLIGIQANGPLPANHRYQVRRVCHTPGLINFRSSNDSVKEEGLMMISELLMQR